MALAILAASIAAGMSSWNRCFKITRWFDKLLVVFLSHGDGCPVVWAFCDSGAVG